MSIATSSANGFASGSRPLAPFQGGDAYSRVWVPAHTNARPNGSGRDAGLALPIRKALALAADAYEVIVGAVVHLCLTIRPAAVLLAIRAIYVDAVETVSFGSGSEVAIELGEVIAPGIANSDTAATVIPKCFIARKIAALLHFAPGFIFRAVSHAMRRAALDRLFSSEASAACGRALQKSGCIHWFDSAAITSTLPTRSLTSEIFHCGPPSEAMSSQITALRHYNIVHRAEII